MASPSESSSTALVVTTTALATVAFLAFAKATLWPSRPNVLPNPMKTGGDFSALAYQPHQLPGARDVETPYGSIHVYEYGPEDGEKVLFIHGISTPCITLAPIANALVERGCRVMLFVRSHALFFLNCSSALFKLSPP
ncbi:hypothetical protein G7046_g7210 [Stylonectria norvegica]|nr:hypothetical protein G7046_g7210 [Stylonectria norvegica]